ncbi:MAG: hypothetical protein CME64_01970 [Halobacteriovoraceae bacterium]|nr:hypothetical protein [Halobacteriovoraceae bacterium]|tara:strand:+ start:29566 stop:30870 length:1305 start_codon:yes stop_codon:yes gene_type:complete
MKKTAKDFLSKKPIFLVTDNKLDRTSWKKTFNELGVLPDRIHSFDTFDEAIRQMEALKPKVLLCTSELKDKNPEGLLSAFRKQNFNRSEDLCYLVCDEETQTIPYLTHEYQLDGFITKPYTANDLNVKIKKVLDEKASYGGFLRAKHKAYENLFLEDNEKVEAFFNLCEHKGSLEEADVLFLKGLHKIKTGEVQQGVETLLEIKAGCLFNYLLRKELFERLTELDRYAEAFEQAKSLIDEFVLPINFLQRFIKSAILSKNFDSILEYSLKLGPEDLTEEGAGNYLAAGLVLSSPILAKTSKENAVTANVRAIKFASHKNNIIEQAMQNLCDLQEFELVSNLIEEMAEDQELEEALSVPLYRALVPMGESPAKVFQKGVDLTSKGVRDFYVYEIMLELAVKLGRKKEYLVELAEDAGKYHPAKESYFRSLIQGRR